MRKSKREHHFIPQVPSYREESYWMETGHRRGSYSDITGIPMQTHAEMGFWALQSLSLPSVYKFATFSCCWYWFRLGRDRQYWESTTHKKPWAELVVDTSYPGKCHSHSRSSIFQLLGINFIWNIWLLDCNFFEV